MLDNMKINKIDSGKNNFNKYVMVVTFGIIILINTIVLYQSLVENKLPNDPIAMIVVPLVAWVLMMMCLNK